MAQKNGQDERFGSVKLEDFLHFFGQGADNSFDGRQQFFFLDPAPEKAFYPFNPRLFKAGKGRTSCTPSKQNCFLHVLHVPAYTTC